MVSVTSVGSNWIKHEVCFVKCWSLLGRHGPGVRMEFSVRLLSLRGIRPWAGPSADLIELSRWPGSLCDRVRVILAARWRSFTTSSSSTRVGSGTHASSSLCEYSTYLVFLCHSSWTHHDSNLKLKLVFPIQDTLPTSSVEITQCLVCPPATAYHQEPLGTQVSHPYIILLTPDSRHPSSQCLLSPPASKKTMHYKMHSDFVSLGHNWRKITQNTASYAISNSIFRKLKVNSGFFNSHLPLCCV